MKALALMAMLFTTGPEGLATDKDYKIITQGSTTALKKGGSGTWQVSITPLNGFRVSDETPLSATLTATPGLKLASTKVVRKDVVDAKSKTPGWKVTFAADAVGVQTIKSDIAFFLCTEKLCQRMTTTQTLNVKVE